MTTGIVPRTRPTCGICGTRDATTITRLAPGEPDVFACAGCADPQPPAPAAPVRARDHVLAVVRRFEDGATSREIAAALGVCPSDYLVMNRLAQRLTRLKRRGAIVADGPRNGSVYRAVR